MRTGSASLFSASLLAIACTQNFGVFDIADLGGHVRADAGKDGGDAGVLSSASGGAPGGGGASPGSGGSVAPSSGGRVGVRDAGSSDGAPTDASAPDTGPGYRDAASGGSSFTDAGADASGDRASTCAEGFGDCNGTSSDGCETDTTSSVHECGSCGNDCSAQRSGFVCTNSLCGCHADPDCHVGAGGQGTITCDTGTGLCHCDATTTCDHGEVCRQGACSCNAGKACTSGQTCCDVPPGCVDLTTSISSCGACGHACPRNFECDQGACECTDDPSCNAGSPGTCASGVCTCGATLCPKGLRCLGNGACG